MGKSIRSKRKKRLRTIKREIAESHELGKDAPKMAALEAACAAPKVEPITRRQPESGDDGLVRGRSAARSVAPMCVDSEEALKSTDVKLKPTGGIRKRGKSKSKRELAGKRKKNVKF